MTLVLTDIQAPARLRPEDVAELHALTAALPHMVTGWSAPVPMEPALRLDLAMWQVARRHGVRLQPTDSLLDVADRLTATGWSRGPARDALRAYVMLRSTPSVDAEAAARVIAYLELRARYG
jgi:hypothetical protein